MLMASSSRIVGATKSQAMARSDRPLTFRATLCGVAKAARSIGLMDI
jgi:hypothetical protein